MLFVLSVLVVALLYAFVGGAILFVLLNMLLPLLGIACIGFKACAIIALTIGIIKTIF